ncbi:MAG: hypothetical protein ACRDLL_10145 [Solirubrobacterales bacterium]
MRARSSLLALLAAVVGIGAFGVAGCGGGDSSTPASENAAATSKGDNAMKHGDGGAMKDDGHGEAMRNEDGSAMKGKDNDAMKHDESGAMKHEGEAMKDGEG